MRPQFSSAKSILATVTVAAALGVAGWQWNRIHHLRQRLQLRPETLQEQPPPMESEAPLTPAETQELARLREENRDLYKLRGEVAQLRKLKPEIEKARAENVRLRQVREKLGQVAQLDQMPGFIAKESWRDAGFATPEDTALTFFWGLREGRSDRVLATMIPEIQKKIGPELLNPSDKQREEMAAVFGSLKGMRIVDKNFVNNDEVTLGVQSALFGDKTMKLSLQRVGNEWKISREPHD